MLSIFHFRGEKTSVVDLRRATWGGERNKMINSKIHNSAF